MVDLLDQGGSQLFDPCQKPADAPRFRWPDPSPPPAARGADGNQCARPQHRPTVAKGCIRWQPGFDPFRPAQIRRSGSPLARPDHRASITRKVGGHLVASPPAARCRRAQGRPRPPIPRRPSRNTEAFGASMPRIAAIAASALPSWMKPMMAFASTTARITPRYRPNAARPPSQPQHRSAHRSAHCGICRRKRTSGPPRPHFRQAVWPMFGQPPRRLGRSQTIGCCGKVGKAIGDGDGVRFGQVHHRAV